MALRAYHGDHSFERCHLDIWHLAVGGNWTEKNLVQHLRRCSSARVVGIVSTAVWYHCVDHLNSVRFFSSIEIHSLFLSLQAVSFETTQLWSKSWVPQICILYFEKTLSNRQASKIRSQIQKYAQSVRDKWRCGYLRGSFWQWWRWQLH